MPAGCPACLSHPVEPISRTMHAIQLQRRLVLFLFLSFLSSRSWFCFSLNVACISSHLTKTKQCYLASRSTGQRRPYRSLWSSRRRSSQRAAITPTARETRSSTPRTTCESRHIPTYTRCNPLRYIPSLPLNVVAAVLYFIAAIIFTWSAWGGSALTQTNSATGATTFSASLSGRGQRLSASSCVSSRCGPIPTAWAVSHGVLWLTAGYIAMYMLVILSVSDIVPLTPAMCLPRCGLYLARPAG